MTITTYDQLIQGTDEWLQARAGIVTASTIGRLITSKTLKPASNDTARDLVRTLVAERLTGRVDHTPTSYAMEYGTLAEPHARTAYERCTSDTVTEVGFIKMTTDHYTLGYSPDGLIGTDGLLEIKSPRPKNHLHTLIMDRVPPQYIPQVQTGLYVTGRDWLDFVSYHPGMPLYITRVLPDPDWHAAIDTTMRTIEEQMRALMDGYHARAAHYPPTKYIDVMAEEDIF